MPLRHCIDNKKFTPETRAKHECVAGLRSKLPPKSFEKLERIIDESIDQVVEAKEGGKLGLVYTKTGFMLGHQSSAPHADIEYVWNKISTTLIGKKTNVVWTDQESRLVLKTIGALVMYRMSLRDEDWLVNFEETNRMDIVTGTEIKIAEYWIRKAA
jgi:hypothetical protein